MSGWEPPTSSDHDWGRFEWPESDDERDEATTASDTTANDPVAQRRADAAAHASSTTDPPWQHLLRPARAPARSDTRVRRLVGILAAVAAVVGIALLSPDRPVTDRPAEDPFAAEVDRSELITLDQADLSPIGAGDPGLIVLQGDDPNDVRRTSARAELAVIETVMRADPDLDIGDVAGLVAARAPEQIQVLVMGDDTSGDWCVQIGDGVIVLHLDAGDTITPGRC